MHDLDSCTKSFHQVIQVLTPQILGLHEPHQTQQLLEDIKICFDLTLLIQPPKVV
jgi:hypothetical protein